MIFNEHCMIRAAEPDDAPSMKRLYDPAVPRAALLDRHRERIDPSLGELREIIVSKDVKLFQEYYAVEDLTGLIRGFCSLRTGRQDVFFCELLFMFIDESDLDTEMAEEAFGFMKNKAFVERRLNKMMAHCLDSETRLRAFFTRHGFHSDGVAREVVFSLGRWFNNETLSLFAAQNGVA